MTETTDRFYNYIFADLQGCRTKMLIDSGASRACVSETYFQRFKRARIQSRPLAQDEPTHLLSATGDELKCVGTADLQINFDGHVVVHKFLVLRGLQHNCVIGMDLLQHCHADIRIRDHVLDLFYGLVVIPMHCDQDRFNVLKLTKDVHIPAHAEAVVSVTLPSRINALCPSITEAWPSLQYKYIAVARALVQPQDG